MHLTSGTGHAALAEWLIESREWTPLHHLEVLSRERACALLRSASGTALRWKPSPTTPSPLERAQQLERHETRPVAASLVLRAAGPWSPEAHELFGDAQRARAEALVRSLYHLYMRRLENGGWQAVDFAQAVLLHAIRRTD